MDELTILQKYEIQAQNAQQIDLNLDFIAILG
jgi:hypothetical protein